MEKVWGGLVKAGSNSGGLGIFNYASKYGVESYSALKKMVKGSGNDEHHLTEKRFAEKLGVKTGEMLSIVLTKAEHIKFTTLWRLEIPYGKVLGKSLNTSSATVDQIKAAARNIYQDYPEIIKALGL